MTKQEQAYIEGFVKRASEYGYSEEQSLNILKEASFGEMLGKLPKNLPGPAGLFAGGHGRQTGYYKKILEKFPELSHGADINAISRIRSPKDMQALSEVTGRGVHDVENMIGGAWDAKSHRDIVRDMKKNLLDELPAPSRPGFKRHARSEALARTEMIEQEAAQQKALQIKAQAEAAEAAKLQAHEQLKQEMSSLLAKKRYQPPQTPSLMEL
jgi:hypothetical protein